MTTALERPTNGHAVDVEALYREQRSRLVSAAARTTRNASSAEDAVQEAFAGLIGGTTRPDDPTAYLVRLTRNRAVDEVRHVVRQAPNGEVVDRLAETKNADGSGLDVCMADPRVAAKVTEALATLTANQRHVIEAHFLAGRKISDLAKEEGLTPGAIYDRINRGLASLKAAGVELPGLDDESDPIDTSGLSPTVARGVEELAATYGRVPPPDLPGPSELGRRFGWDTKKSSAARAAYTGTLVRPGRKSPTKPAAKATKKATPAKAKATPVKAVEAPRPSAAPSVAEAWLNRSGDDVTAMFVNTDESTTNHPAVFRSMPGAQREITGHLVAQGYRPAGAWVEHSADEASRNFTNATEGN